MLLILRFSRFFGNAAQSQLLNNFTSRYLKCGNVYESSQEMSGILYLKVFSKCKSQLYFPVISIANTKHNCCSVGIIELPQKCGI